MGYIVLCILEDIHSVKFISRHCKKWNFYSRSNVQKSNKIKVVLLFKRPSHFQWSYQQLIYYLTGALWPVSSKAIPFAQVNNLSAYLSCRAWDVHLCGVCPRLRCAVKDKLLCLDWSASIVCWPSGIHETRMKVKICVKDRKAVGPWRNVIKNKIDTLRCT